MIHEQQADLDTEFARLVDDQAMGWEMSDAERHWYANGLLWPGDDPERAQLLVAERLARRLTNAG